MGSDQQKLLRFVPPSDSEGKMHLSSSTASSPLQMTSHQQKRLKKKRMCNELTCLKSLNRQYPAPIADLQQDKLKVSSTHKIKFNNMGAIISLKYARKKMPD